ncbi:MAG: response regulator [Terriglobales bacterium]|jgi:two-component system KDP operon response regulator KdpE
MNSQKILIVDDNADIRLGMHLRLKANHYQTFFAADAPSAVAEARKNQPDLIVLDLGLPAGDGFTVMENLRQIPLLATIPVIVVSARDGLANQKRVYEAGAKAFLQKPLNDAELLAVIRQALAETSGTEMPALDSQGSL